MLRELVLKGGPVMYPLILCSVTALPAALERFFYFARLRRSANGIEGKLQSFRRLMQAGEINKATVLLKGNKGPIARIFLAGLSAGEPENGARDAEHAASIERRHVFAGLRILDTVVTAAPLLGLLGTVTGILRTFRVLGSSAIALNMQAVGLGIAEALITTATGLVIAIPTLVLMNYFTHRAETIDESIEHEVTNFWRSPAGRGDGHGQTLEA